MIVDQIAVYVENKLGTLAEVTEIMGDAGIDLRALSIADSSDFGVLRIIADDPARAHALLKEAGFVVSTTQVLAVPLADAPGSLAKVLRILAEKGISVEYAYAFITRKQGNAYVILRVADNVLARDVLAGGGVDAASDGNLFDQ
ncbi:MAG: ACT domain-containing protein [Synergistaceae bacterium]|jgi:hypothetical protein|nr:ACT domain-containing protein [Synergistaceae bacterium]